MYRKRLCAWIIGLCFSVGAGQASAEELYLRVVDVGNALCVVIKAPGGGRMLYDAGNVNGSNCLKAVKSIIGADDIDLVVLSHSDADHIGELPAILGEYKGRVSQLVHTRHPATSDIYGDVIAAIEDPITRPLQVRDLAIRKNARGEHIEIGQHELPNTNEPLAGRPRAPAWTLPLGDARVTFVAGWDNWPGPIDGMDDSEMNNVVSIVVRIDYGGHSVLLTGDTIGRTGEPGEPARACLGAEKWMVDNAAPLIDADVLIGQHHGGDNSSARCFIEAVSPRYVVFPAGHVTKYMHVRLTAARRFTGDGIPGFTMITPGGRMFQSDRGDDQGALEWSPQRIAGCSDLPGDDDIEVFISDRPETDPRVRYRTANGACRR